MPTSIPGPILICNSSFKPTCALSTVGSFASLSVCLSVFVRGTYIMHTPQQYRAMLCTIDLHCVPLACVVHHKGDLYSCHYSLQASNTQAWDYCCDRQCSLPASIYISFSDTMTKLLEWLTCICIFLAVWAAFVTDSVPLDVPAVYKDVIFYVSMLTILMEKQSLNGMRSM